MTKTVYAIITVDGDLRIGSSEQKKAAIDAMREIHRRAGLIGSTTWFINEYDFHWTKIHPASLLDLYDSGDDLEIHDHQDTHYVHEFNQALEMMRMSKDSLEGFFDQHRSGICIRAHRNGSAYQSEDIYRALEKLGYDIVSDVWPGMFWSGRIVQDGDSNGVWQTLPADNPDSIIVDNRNVPLGVLPWRHRADNWMDYHSQTGPFLHLPITTLPLIDRGRIRQAVENSSENVIVVTDTHPYDLQDSVSGEVSQQACEAHMDSFLWMINEYNPRFLRVQDAAEIVRSIIR